MPPEETTKYGPGCYLVDQEWYRQNKEQLKIDKTEIEELEAERDELQDRNTNQKLMIEGLRKEVGETKQDRHDTRDYQRLKIEQLQEDLVDAHSKLVYDNYLHTENDRLIRKNNDLIDELAAVKETSKHSLEYLVESNNFHIENDRLTEKYRKLEEDDNFVRRLNDTQTEQICGLADALDAAKKGNEQLSSNLNNTLFNLSKERNDRICFENQVKNLKHDLERYVCDPNSRDKYERIIAVFTVKLKAIKEIIS